MKDLILDYLKNNNGKTPTEMGLYLGFDYKKASASVTKALQELIWDKAILRTKENKKVIYKAI